MAPLAERNAFSPHQCGSSYGQVIEPQRRDTEAT
jgi:hypothetical protein